MYYYSAYRNSDGNLAFQIHSEKQNHNVIGEFVIKDNKFNFPKFLGKDNRQYEEFLQSADKLRLSIPFNVLFSGWGNDEIHEMLSLLSYVKATRKDGSSYDKTARGVKFLRKMGDSYELIQESEVPVYTYKWQYGEAEAEYIQFTHTGNGSKVESLTNYIVSLRDTELAKLLPKLWTLDVEPDTFTQVTGKGEGYLTSLAQINAALTQPFDEIAKSRLEKGKEK